MAKYPYCEIAVHKNRRVKFHENKFYKTKIFYRPSILLQMPWWMNSTAPPVSKFVRKYLCKSIFSEKPR